MSSDSLLRVARVTHNTTAEGPGQRTALWVQGCSIRCAGCINPHLFSSRGGTLVAPASVIQDAQIAGDEGLTILGGEPFDQVEAVADLARQARLAGLGVICFTGYTIETIRASPDGDYFLRHVDLLIDGPYLAGSPENGRALVGSTNQRFIHLTSRYAEYEPQHALHRVDMRILSTGEVSIAGFITTEHLTKLADALDARRLLKP